MRDRGRPCGLRSVVAMCNVLRLVLAVLGFTHTVTSLCSDSILCDYYSSTHNCELSPQTTVDQCPIACRNPCLCDWSHETNDTACDCLERAKKGHCTTVLISFGCDTTCDLVKTVNCPALQPPEDPNAYLTTDATSYLTEVKEKCNVGFTQLSYSAVGKKICLSTGEWFSDTVYGKSITCLMVDCGEPPSSFNAEVDWPDGSNFGDVATYSCVPNADPFSGQTTLTCTTSGQWVGTPLTCSLRRCRSRPPTVEHATYSLVGSLIGDTVNYTCDLGYTQAGGQVALTCAENQTWVGELLDCQLVDCGPPPTRDDVEVVVVTTTYRSVANCTCQPGYLPSPEQTMFICDVTGHWRGSFPTCTAVDCGQPPNSDTAVHTAVHTTYGHQAHYECIPGYQRETGDWSLFCNYTATWDGELLACVEKDCGPPLERDVTHVTYTTTTFRSSAQYTCAVGHEAVDGDAERVCQEDGTWSGNALVCLASPCDAAPVFSGARQWTLSESDPMVYQDEMLYECFYEEEGREGLRWTLTCGAQSEWEGEEPECGASSPVKRKTYVPEPLEAPGSWAVGFAIFGVLIFFIILFVVMDINTLRKHSKYLKANLISFKKMSIKAWRSFRGFLAQLKLPQLKLPRGDVSKATPEHDELSQARSVSSISANLPISGQTTA